MLKEEERPNIKHYLKISITNENLQKRLQALNPNQFADPDGIHQKIFKETAPEISKPLQIISNESVKQGKLASAWKKVSIKAIYKIKPDEHCATNYRSMILAIMICNLMKMFIKDATVRVPHTKNILTNKQFGFMKGSLQSWNLQASNHGWMDKISIKGWISRCCLIWFLERIWDCSTQKTKWTNDILTDGRFISNLDNWCFNWSKAASSCRWNQVKYIWSDIRCVARISTWSFIVSFLHQIKGQKSSGRLTLRERCPNTEFFLVLISSHWDWIQRDTE